jgi:hypothetical protein
MGRGVVMAGQDPEMPKRPPSTPESAKKVPRGKALRIARALAQSTLLAAGIAAAQAGGPEMDARFHMFDPTLVDRLQAPITRHHE